MGTPICFSPFVLDSSNKLQLVLLNNTWDFPSVLFYFSGLNLQKQFTMLAVNCFTILASTTAVIQFQPEGLTLL